MLRDKQDHTPLGVISKKFHNTLTEVIGDIARKVGQSKIVLSGGCFQNRYLTENAINKLREENFKPYWHQRVPPDDGGISVGQIGAVIFNINFDNVRRKYMCLAVPGKIVSIQSTDPILRTGKVSFAGIVKEVSLTYVPEAEIDDYVIVHAGFAISKIDEEEANQIFQYLEQMGDLEIEDITHNEVSPNDS